MQEESLRFIEHRKKPTQDGRNYEPYKISEIIVIGNYDLEITCISSDAALNIIDALYTLAKEKEAIQRRSCSLEEIVHQEGSPTFTMEGEVYEFTCEFARLGYISRSLCREIIENKEVQELPYYSNNGPDLIDLQDFKEMVLRLAEVERIEAIEKLIFEKTQGTAEIFYSSCSCSECVISINFRIPGKFSLNEKFDLYMEINRIIPAGDIKCVSSEITSTPLNGVVYSKSNIENVRIFLLQLEADFTRAFFEGKIVWRCKPTPEQKLAECCDSSFEDQNAEQEKSPRPH